MALSLPKEAGQVLYQQQIQDKVSGLCVGFRGVLGKRRSQLLLKSGFLGLGYGEVLSSNPSTNKNKNKAKQASKSGSLSMSYTCSLIDFVFTEYLLCAWCCAIP
jgi:hypothetical protein